MGYLSKIKNISIFASYTPLNNPTYISRKSLSYNSKIFINYNYNRWKPNITIGNKRFYTTNSTYCELEDDYYISQTESSCYLLGVTKNKFKDFKEIVYINFTEEKELNKGDYLFSVEDSKTLFDFYSPLNCTIEHINSKFTNQTTQEKLNDLFNNPEDVNNYLVKIKKN